MNTQKGFTLLELMIVIVVVSILALIAVPSYQSYMIKTRRATAAACLLELSQSMERFHTVNMSYAKDTNGNDSVLPATQCRNDLTGHYVFSLTNQAARTYLVSAAPQGAQANNDPYACGTLTIDQAGQKDANGDISTCWR